MHLEDQTISQELEDDIKCHMYSRMPLDSNKKEEKLCQPENTEKWISINTAQNVNIGTLRILWILVMNVWENLATRIRTNQCIGRREINDTIRRACND